VRTWLSASELPALAIGQEVVVGADWARGGRASGRVTRIGEALAFPPTNFATRVIHLTRAVPVEATVDSDEPLPPGTPVDISFNER
jgi:hypothetical protein